MKTSIVLDRDAEVKLHACFTLRFWTLTLQWINLVFLASRARDTALSTANFHSLSSRSHGTFFMGRSAAGCPLCPPLQKYIFEREVAHCALLIGSGGLFTVLFPLAGTQAPVESYKESIMAASPRRPSSPRFSPRFSRFLFYLISQSISINRVS